jgi:Hemolysins and related proteins containing CBS domains
MDATIFEVIVIAILLLANGVFAMTEMALVSSRKARLEALAESGNRGARAALDLKESPNRFLSTVQIGITLIGILAGAFGGATIAKEIGETFANVPIIGPHSQKIALFGVVLVITYLSLVIGELVPKRLALQRPEAISGLVARPMQALSRLAAPAVHVLSFSTETILRLFGVRETKMAPVTEEEVAGLVREGLQAGVFLDAESEMVESVLALDRLHVKHIMTPRTRIVWIASDESHEQVWHKIVVSNHSHFPVYDDNPDQVLGFVSVKSIYANLAAGVPVDIEHLITPALIVPETQSAIHLLETFKREGRHIALVTDEFGGIAGLVTINDLLEAIVGDLPEAGEKQSAPFVRREDGSLLVDALVGLEELEEFLPGFAPTDDERRHVSTLGGYICARLGRLPVEGESFDAHGYRFEVVDMDRRRVDKVLVRPGTETTRP